MADGSVVIDIKGDDSDFRAKISDSGDTAESALSKISGGLKKLAAAAAVTQAVGAVKDFAATCVDAYGDFEQLDGGAQLLWGDAYDYISEKAAGAYSAVQMSQNDYLQQVNGLSTGLKVALGGNAQAAAELADRVVTAEADVVSATGASQEAVQNAFNGIMKSNFTMLDNLQLGITPTKEGFQEVIDKVNEWNAANGRATDYQIDNLADCQSALVDYIEMQGMAGYAAAEAADTIQGSVAGTKAAYENWLVGLGTADADMAALTQNLIDQALNVRDNVVPVLETMLANLGGVGEYLASQLVPIVGEQVSAAFSSLGDTLDGLPGKITEFCAGAAETIASSAPDIAAAAVEMLAGVVDGITSTGESADGGIVEMVAGMAASLLECRQALQEGALTLLTAIVDAVGETAPQVLEALPGLVGQLAEGLAGGEHVSALLAGALALFQAIVDALGQIAPALVEAVPAVVSELVGALGGESAALSDGAAALFGTVAEALSGIGGSLAESATSLVSGLADSLASMAGTLAEAAAALFGGIAQSLSDGTVLTDASAALSDVVYGIAECMPGLVDTVASAAATLFAGIAEAIPAVLDVALPLLTTLVSDLAGALPGLATALLDAAATFWASIGDALATYGPTVLSSLGTLASDLVSKVVEYGPGLLSAAGELFANLVTALADKASELLGDLAGNLGEVCSGVSGAAGELLESARTLFASMVEASRRRRCRSRRTSAPCWRTSGRRSLAARRTCCPPRRPSSPPSLTASRRRPPTRCPASGGCCPTYGTR